MIPGFIDPTVCACIGGVFRTDGVGEFLIQQDAAKFQIVFSIGVDNFCNQRCFYFFL